VVVGTGKRGMHHAVHFQADPSFEEVGLCDIDEARVKAAADKLGNAPRTGTNAAALAKELKPDVFCFCTHPALRQDLIRTGVECGAKLIAFEKPIGLTSADALAVKSMLEGSKAKAVVSHQHRYGVHYRKVQEIVASGALGRVHTVYAQATGWMLHMMSHMLDYMRWYNGNAAASWVMAQAAGRRKLADNHPSPDYIAGVIQYANGVRGWVEVGAGAPDQPEVGKWWGKNRIGVQGTEGFAEVLTNGGWRAVTAAGVQRGEGAMSYDLDMPPYIRDMAVWLDGGAEHPCSFANAYDGFMTMAAMMRSAAEGGQVALPLTDPVDEMALLKKRVPDRAVLFGADVHRAEYGG